MADAMELTERSELMRWTTAQLLATLVQSLVLAVIVRAVVAGFGELVSIAAAWSVALVAVAAVRLQRLALPGTGSRRRRKLARLQRTTEESDAAVGLGAQAREPVAALPETMDRRFRRLARHTDRVTYAVVATRHFESGVRPVLAELARDRVRRHHGIDMAAEPERARDLIGEDLWQALTTPRTTAPTTAELDRWLTTLERLSAEPADERLSARPAADRSGRSWRRR